MKAKCLALIIAGVVLSVVSYAQDYSIRANRGLNLRAEPSLNADIAGTVTAGTVLQVVGEQGGWLQINRNGGVVWLANWVNYSRLDSSEPTESQQPTAQINNCCFVDRQCLSDQEWTDGYWAYQNGQCAAPAQPAASTASRPPIEGSSRFLRQVTAALNWLERRAPEWYNYVISAVDLIFEVPVPVQSIEETCTALAYSPQRKVSLETCITNKFQWDGLSARWDELNTAEVLAHEACHIHRHEAGFVYDSSTRDHEETECGKPMIGVSLSLDPHRRYWTYIGEPAISIVRRFCTEGFNPELYCPAIERMQGG